MTEKDFMKAAIDAALRGMNSNEGGPFGAVIVKDNNIIATGNNKVTTWNDPTAHAEIVAIRKACEVIGNFQLSDCDLYTSCEPCPMCMGAIYWARFRRVIFACDKNDAAQAGFDDEFIYEEIEKLPSSRKIPFTQLMQIEAKVVFNEWIKKEDKIKY